MKIKFILLLSCLFTIQLLFINPMLAAEHIKIKGKIVDKETAEPIPYVNIAIIEAGIGTISNINGVFELNIPEEHSAKIISISAIGYAMQQLIIGDYKEVTTILIELVAENYQIDEVDVNAKSLVVYKYVKEAVKNMPQNYMQQAFNYRAYYRNEEKTNNVLTRLREAAVLIYDKKGYVRGTAHEQYIDRNYKFLQVRRNFDLNTLSDKSTNLDGLLEMDIVRLKGNVLDTNYIQLFDLKLEEITVYDNDSVWVISYECKKPALNTTGDYYANKYSGRIYINQKDYAVVKNETWVESTNYSEHGRSVYVNEKDQKWKVFSVKYRFTVIYKKFFDKYYLSYINYHSDISRKNKNKGKKEELEYNTEIMINQTVTNEPEIIEKRAYYENIPFDAEFWEHYNYLLDKE